MKKNNLIKYSFGIGALLCGVSGYAVLHKIADDNAKEFNQNKVVINENSISMQQFYYNLSYSNKGWLYTDENGNKINIDSLCDINYLDQKAHAFIKHINLKTTVDTIYASYDVDILKKEDKKEIVYKDKNNNTMRDLLLFGKYNYDVLNMKEFVSNDPEIQKEINKYNNKYNCTYAHEFQHYLNTKNGLRLWNSYKIKFVECCMDEISATIAQLLAQRENYLNNNGDLNFIDDRFASYKQAIQKGVLTPNSGKISQKEIKFIADTVFDYWMENKFDLYEHRTNDRTKYYLQDAPFMAIQDDLPKHNFIMQKIFTIDGYDFWKYISKHENKIFDRINPKINANFIKLRKIKYQKMTYIDKLTQMKINDGDDKYRKTLIKNSLKAKVIAVFGKDKHR